MTIISSSEFAANQSMYFNLAVKEDICIDDGEKMFQLLYSPVEENRERVYYEPDEDFYNSISADEFKRRALEMAKKIHNKYTKQ